MHICALLEHGLCQRLWESWTDHIFGTAPLRIGLSIIKIIIFFNFVRLHHFSHFWYSLIMIVNVSLPKHVPLIIRYCPIWLIPHTLKNNSVLTKKVNKTSILEFCFFFTLLIFSPLPSKWNFHPVLVLSPNESETLAADLTKSLAVKENWSEKVMWKWWEDLNKN